MQLGVDFNGTLIRYAVCASSDGGDGHTITTVETLEAAEHELQKAVNRAKKRPHCTDTKFWIMKQTYKYERIIRGDDNGITTT